MTKQVRYTLPRNKSLKSKILIERLFKQGDSISKYPVRLVYLKTNYDKDENFQVGFSVPKKKFKRAVDRNRIKRLMREAFRLQQYSLPQDKKMILMWIFTGKDMPAYKDIYQSIEQILAVLNTKTQISEQP